MPVRYVTMLGGREGVGGLASFRSLCFAGERSVVMSRGGRGGRE